MKKSFIAAVALSAILGFTSTAFAAIYDNGTGTTDSTSGLDWLDLTASTGRSYADVSGEFGTGGDFEGYRYATVDDFQALINNFLGPDTYDGAEGHFNADVGDLMLLLGVTDDTHGNPNFNDPLYSIVYEATGFIGTPQGSLTQGAHVQSASLYQTILYVLGAPSGVDTSGSNGYGLSSHAHTPQYSSDKVGSYLVRQADLIATPIPAALFMFAPALLGFLGFRRKLQA